MERDYLVEAFLYANADPRLMRGKTSMLLLPHIRVLVQCIREQDAELAAVIGRKEQGREYQKLKEAVSTIPAAVMLAGGPPYRLTFTEECLREILEAQR